MIHFVIADFGILVCKQLAQHRRGRSKSTTVLKDIPPAIPWIIPCVFPTWRDASAQWEWGDTLSQSKAWNCPVKNKEVSHSPCELTVKLSLQRDCPFHPLLCPVWLGWGTLTLTHLHRQHKTVLLSGDVCVHVKMWISCLMVSADALFLSRWKPDELSL